MRLKSVKREVPLAFKLGAGVARVVGRMEMPDVAYTLVHRAELFGGPLNAWLQRLLRGPPFRRYIAWLQGWDASDAEAYWRQELAGLSAPSALAADRADLGNQGDGEPIPRRLRRRVPRATAEGLEELCRRHRLTTGTVFQGLWTHLLTRTSGEDEAVFGLVVAGRPAELSGVERMVGLFINTLPVRVAVETGLSGTEQLAAIQESQAASRAFEATPLSEIQRWSEVPAGRLLFESLVVVENHPVDQRLLASRDGLTVRDARTLGQSSYPMNLEVVPGEDLTVGLAYSRRRFDDTTVARWMGSLLAAAEAWAEDPALPLTDLPLLSSAQEHQLTLEWGEGVAGPEQEVWRPIQDRISAWAEARGGEVALACGESSLSHEALGQRVEELTAALFAAGVEPGDRVGLCQERGTDLVAGTLAIFSAGGVFVPLGSVLSGRALGVHGGGLGYPAGADGGRLPGGAAGVGGDAWRWTASYRRLDSARCARRGDAGVAGLHDLHVGDDGAAEGSGGEPRESGSHAFGVGGGLSHFEPADSMLYGAPVFLRYFSVRESAGACWPVAAR